MSESVIADAPLKVAQRLKSGLRATKIIIILIACRRLSHRTILVCRRIKNMNRTGFKWAVALALMAILPSVPALANPPSGQIEFFEKKIRPVLVNHCYKCHSAGAKKIRSGLLLDSRD